MTPANEYVTRTRLVEWVPSGPYAGAVKITDPVPLVSGTDVDTVNVVPDASEYVIVTVAGVQSLNVPIPNAGRLSAVVNGSNVNEHAAVVTGIVDVTVPTCPVVVGVTLGATGAALGAFVPVVAGVPVTTGVTLLTGGESDT